MSDYILAGHSCPLDQYPSIVLPVCKRPDGETVVLYQGAGEGAEDEVVAETSDYTRYDSVLLDKLKYFDPDLHKLFAWSEFNVDFYDKSQEAEWLTDFLEATHKSNSDPFTRLSLARLTHKPKWVILEIGRCLAQLHESPDFINSWCEHEIVELLEDLGLEPMRTKDPDRAVPPVDGKVILVIEDTAEIAEGIKARYEGRGCTVHIASNPYRGLAMAHELRPNVIILDLRLPYMHGSEVCRRLLSHVETKDIPVVINTAWPEDWQEHRDLFGKETRFVQKGNPSHDLDHELEPLLV